MGNDRNEEEMKNELIRSLESALNKLQGIWRDIGIVESMRKERTDVVLLHLRNLLDEMVREEDVLKNKLMQNVEHYGEKLLKLCKELSLPPHEPAEGLSILQLEKELRTKVDKVEHEKHSRLKKLKVLKESDQHLCDVLCSTPYYIPSGSVPSEEQLKELEQHINNLEAEKGRRCTIFRSTKESIIRLLDDLEQSPNSSFERDIVCEEEDSFLLSNENMNALRIFHDELEQKQKENFSQAARLRERMEQLWLRLQISEEEKTEFNTKHTGFKRKTIHALKEEVARCELLKLENMQKVIMETRKELYSWWDKCFFSQEVRERFGPYYIDDFTEEALELHDLEVMKVKDYYEENKEMLEKVTRRQKLWEDFLEFERKASDPNRFFNRNCNLLKEEKARKKLMKELPKIEQEVHEQIVVWEKENGKEFLVGGVRFLDYVEKQWADYRVQKQAEKTQRQQARVKLTEEEMRFGSKPTTPAKRRLGATPGKTPNKLRKVDKDDESLASTVSSSSNASSTISSSRFQSARKPIQRVKKLNETPKTPRAPASISRLARTNHTSVFSPVCMPPRSTSRYTSRSTTKTQAATADGKDRARKALTDKTQQPTNETLFSQTTVSGSGGGKTTTGASSSSASSASSLASLGPYHEFARGLNQNPKPNCRSSVMPAAIYF